MKNKRLLIIITVMVSLMLACNISFGGDATATQTPVVVVVTKLVPADTAIPQQEKATDTPEALPSETAEIVATSTASTPLVTPLKDPVNCRFGPSIFYEQVFALNVGAYMPVVGKSADGGWWLVGIPKSNNQACWVGKSVTTFTGDQSGIPTVPAPEALVTDLNLRINSAVVNLGSGCTNIPTSPFVLKGTISTNGPLEITWHAETQQDGSLPEHTIKIKQFGTQNISFTFAPTTWKKGNFWIRIVVTQPKGMASDVTYQVKCQ